MKFSDLARYLPANVFEVATNGQLRLNLTVLTNGNLTLDSSALESLGRLLQATYDHTRAVNTQRSAQNLPPITLATKALQTSDRINPIHEFSISIEVNSAPTFDAAIDPTV